MGFAENLQRIRKEKHLSQEELAEMLGVSRRAGCLVPYQPPAALFAGEHLRVRGMLPGSFP